MALRRLSPVPADRGHRFRYGPASKRAKVGIAVAKPVASNASNPPVDSVIRDGDTVVGYVAYDDQQQPWVKREVTLTGQPNSTRWYYRTLDDVNGSLGQSFNSTADR